MTATKTASTADQDKASLLSGIANRIRSMGTDHLKLETLAADLQKQANDLTNAVGTTQNVPVFGQAEAEIPRYVLKDDPNAPKGVPVVEQMTKTEAVERGDLRPGINDVNLAAEQRAAYDPGQQRSQVGAHAQNKPQAHTPRHTSHKAK